MIQLCNCNWFWSKVLRGQWRTTVCCGIIWDRQNGRMVGVSYTNIYIYTYIYMYVYIYHDPGVGQLRVPSHSLHQIETLRHHRLRGELPFHFPSDVRKNARCVSNSCSPGFSRQRLQRFEAKRCHSFPKHLENC